MTTRAEQRQRTRQRIVEAAIEAFAANGFDGSGTRDIAARADVTQGLITYHFDSKLDLWRAAANRLFADLAEGLPSDVDIDSQDTIGVERVRDVIRSYVRFSAERPQLFHFMVDAGRHDDDRMTWLVDTHLRRWFLPISQLAGSDELAPHVHYALIGASSLFFALEPENRTLTGSDPLDSAAVERHADFVARLFVPGPD